MALFKWLGSYGVGLVINILRVQLPVPAVHSRVGTWIGDRLRASEPSRYVAGLLRQLSLPSLWG